MVFYTASGFFRCYRCGVRGVADHWTAPTYAKSAHSKSDTASVGQPLGWTPLWTLDATRSEALRPALALLARRGIDPTTWAEARIGACLRGPAANRVVVPLLDERRAWWGWVARSWARDPELRYRTASGMNRDRLYNEQVLDIETDAPVLAVEGVFDALPYWPDAVAFLGKPGAEQIERLARARRPVVIALDGDAWKESIVTHYRVRVLSKTANVCAIVLPPARDPGELDPDVVWAMAADAVDAHERRLKAWSLSSGATK